MSSKDSKRSAREALAAEREKQRVADKRRQRIINTVIVVVVAVVVVGIFVAVQQSRNSGPSDAALPDTVTQAGEGATFGDGPVTVDLWVDFQCPVCKGFEKTNAESLTQRVDNGDITLVVHPLSFLDDSSHLGNTSSIRAAAAYGCALASGTDKALAFQTKLFEEQPPENPGTEAWSNADLVKYGNDVGISGKDWEDCVNNQTYAGWAQQVEGTMAANGITGTPAVFVDGTPAWPLGQRTIPQQFFASPDALNQLIDDAAKSATPSPSSS